MLGQKSCGQSESHCFSKWQRNALAKVGPSGDPKHPNIKFTFEHQYDHSFLFLDLKICRENNKFTTSVYEVFTNFKSFIPTVYKFGLVYTLLHRCFNIISYYEKFHNEINALKQIFKTNGYPFQFIDRCIK